MASIVHHPKIIKAKVNISFDFNVNSILELNLDGKILSLNLACRAHFPDLIRKGISHPLLLGLFQELMPLLKQDNEAIMFIREVNYRGNIYEQQIYIIAQENLISIQIVDVSKTKSVEKIIYEANQKIDHCEAEYNQKLEVLQSKINQMNKTFHEAKSNLHFALDSAEVGTWNWDILNNIVIWDDYMSQLFGVSHRQYVLNYDDVIKLIHPEDRQRIVSDIKHCVKNNSLYHSSVRIHHENANHNLQVRGRVYTDEDSHPVYMAGICHKLD